MKSPAFLRIDKLAGTDTLRMTIQVGAERDPLIIAEVQAKEFVDSVSALRYLGSGDTALIPAQICTK